MKVKAKQQKRPNEYLDTPSASQTKWAKAWHVNLIWRQWMSCRRLLTSWRKSTRKANTPTSLVQFHCWGNSHYDSYDQPPNKPFFSATKKAAASAPSAPGTVSPSSRIHLRSECIDQLTNWWLMELSLWSIKTCTRQSWMILKNFEITKNSKQQN